LVSNDAEWDRYAQSTSKWLIRAHYYFTVWRNYQFLLHGLSIPQGRLLELGSSTGQISLRLAIKYKLSPTLVDSSLIALAQAYQNFRAKHLSPKLLHKDVRDFKINKKFDLVHSHGLLEHFSGNTRKNVLNSHIEHIRKGGWLICWVPTPDVFYYINRWYLTKKNQWIFGFEEPIHLRDFVDLVCNEKLVIRRIRRPPGWIGIAAQYL
jgi:cyclopropane fatty-acyl-phospholipid synthase-like methyltransferase